MRFLSVLADNSLPDDGLPEFFDKYDTIYRLVVRDRYRNDGILWETSTLQP